MSTRPNAQALQSLYCEHCRRSIPLVATAVFKFIIIMMVTSLVVSAFPTIAALAWIRFAIIALSAYFFCLPSLGYLRLALQVWPALGGPNSLKRWHTANIIAHTLSATTGLACMLWTLSPALMPLLR